MHLFPQNGSHARPSQPTSEAPRPSEHDSLTTGGYGGARPSPSSRAADGHVVWGGVEVSASGSDNERSKRPGSSDNGGDGRQDRGDTGRTEASRDFSGVVFLSDSSERECNSSGSDACDLAPERNRNDNDASASSERRHAAKPSSVAKRHPNLASMNAQRFAAGTGNELSNSGQWSKGSALHSVGKCKPCAWSWKSGGCVQGVACLFCHTCDAGAHKQYKKDRLASLKNNRQGKMQSKAVKVGEVLPSDRQSEFYSAEQPLSGSVDHHLCPANS